ncbi:secretin N-terminal domain-containing protein [Aeoliella sp. SH292]|uniref:secretin N-terminal domain-containing protein n=1 Tax=Aeoliella sp. SH292 TaxID=3454464 RepID=UPI003F9E38BD
MWYIAFASVAVAAPNAVKSQQLEVPRGARLDRQTASKEVQLNLPGTVTLNVLADLVSERLGVKIIYNDDIRQEKINIKAPQQIPEDSVLPLLESILKIKGFALIDADVPGWKRIVKSANLTEIARPRVTLPTGEVAPTEAVTQSFVLKHISPQRLEELIKPFLTEPGANTIRLDEQNTLIVTDYASNLDRISQLIQTIDLAGPESMLEFYKVQHEDAANLQKQITQVLADRVAAAPAGRVVAPLKITPDTRTNQLLITGSREQVAEALALAQALDVSLGLESRVYSFRYVQAARIDRLVRDLLDPVTAERLYRSSVDDEDNLLIVSGTKDIHDRVEAVRRQMDVEARRPGSAMQFYKIKHTDAAEILQTILSVQQGTTSLERFGDRGVSPLGRGRMANSQYGIPWGYDGQFLPGPNQPAIPGAALPPTTPAFVPTTGIESGQAAIQPNLAPATPAPAPETSITTALAPEAAKVTADPTTNSIIVVADRATQQVYADLIKFLDRPRPQVMIEAQIVIIDTTDNYALGIEISGGDGLGISKAFQFTSYGLSMVDPATGALSLIPGTGYNGTIVNPEVADAVVRALSTHTKARVMSSPRVLVKDNETGTLASVAEVPFTSVNASQTVATTSFAGFAEAGTTIDVTPRIIESDRLDLEFVVTLNSFTGAGSDGVPPPRQTNEVASSVTVPNGYTVIVGGLNQQNNSLTQQGIPGIDRIPVLRLLTSNFTSNNSKSTLFVFLRPVIVADDKFEDLKYMSDRDLCPTGLPKNFPTSQPLLIK